MSNATAERLALDRQKRVTQLKRSAAWRFIVGGLLCFTLVGAILGIPLGISGYQKLREAKRITP